MKEMRKFEDNVAKLEKSIAQLRSIHQVELERKDTFYEAEKARVTLKLQASNIAKLLEMCVQQFYTGY